MNEILIVLNAMPHLLARTSSKATCKRTGGEHVQTVVLRSQKNPINAKPKKSKFSAVINVILKQHTATICKRNMN